MLKLQSACLLALIAGSLTLITSILSDSRMFTIFYRTILSIGLFGVLGYVAGSFVEPYLQRLTAEIKPKGQKIDIVNEQKNIDIQENGNQFSPFSQDNLEHISRPPK